MLFHCSAGKDRTGIISAVLLGAAGVSAADILANYEVTYTYIRENPVIARLSRSAPERRAQLYSLREYMEGALDYVARERGGFAKYLTDLGVSPDCLRAIRERFIESLM